ncbi:HAD-IC family P-type ATPase [Candidatus Parcubacteria bacterium]|nr:HAD-IC family P-type ATPase [Candidatus Parcubacteria bacterium]
MIQEELWHALAVDEAFKKLTSTHEGIHKNEAATRLETVGQNVLPKDQPLAWWVLFFRQFASPMIYILIGAAGVTALLRDWTDTLVILGAVFLNTLVGFVQELKANRSLEQLRALVQPKAIIRRDGQDLQVSASQIVPGDILLLATGDRVTADARLIASVELTVNEATLTGESQPVLKQTRVLPDGMPLPERTNMVYAGTSVFGGKAEALVVATGTRTEIGRIAEMVQRTEEPKTPLQHQLAILAKQIALVIAVLIILLFSFGPILGYGLLEMLKMSVALAVAAIPEGLVISVTIVLAIGMQRILKRRSLTRRLVGAETLGSVSIICTDKTGTLTEGEMRATHVLTQEGVFDLTHARAVPKSTTVTLLLEALTLCNNAEVVEDGADHIVRGSPTDRGLLGLAVRLGVPISEIRTQRPRTGELPFDSQYKYLACAHTDGQGSLHLLAGAPERVLTFCTLTQARHTEITAHIHDWSSRGARLVAFARKQVQTEGAPLDRAALGGFTFLGLVVMDDPVRPQARAQVLEAKAAGVRTVMVTGDHPATAQAIAREVGLEAREGSVVSGEELDRWSDDELARRVTDVDVFARVEPRHKNRIIAAWQARGDVVAMVGDGVNDAPALKAADIGVAVGSGTEVAKGAADLVLLDNNLGTITAAIAQGRVIFDNIRKTTVYLVSGSFTEIVLIAFTVLLGLPLPLLPAHILWINLVTDTFPNIGLTLEPAERDLMRERPRERGESVLNAQMTRLVAIIGAVVITGLIGFYLFLLTRFTDAETIRTFMFAAVGLDSLIYVFAIKNLRRSVFHANLFSNPWLFASVGFGFVLMWIAFTFPSLRSLLHLTPLDLSHWLLLIMMGTLKLLVIELVKHYAHRYPAHATHALA